MVNPTFKNLSRQIVLTMLVGGLLALAGTAAADNRSFDASDGGFDAVIELNSNLDQGDATPIAPLAEAVDPADFPSDSVLHLPPVPLPSGALAGLGLIGVMMLYRRRRRSLFRG